MKNVFKRSLLFSLLILTCLSFSSSTIFAQKESLSQVNQVTPNLDGKLFFIQSTAPGAEGRVLDADYFGLGTNGTKVQLWDRNNKLHQQWKFKASDKGANYYYIINRSPKTEKKNRLEAGYGTIGEDGGTVNLWEDNGGTDNQLWEVKLLKNGTYRFICVLPEAKGMSIDADGYTYGENGGKVQMWRTMENNNHQEWKLIPVTSSN